MLNRFFNRQSSIVNRQSSLPFWYPPILTYHRVHPEASAETPTVTPTVFDRQMALLAKRWHPIGLQELAAGLEGTSPLLARAIVVTLDDGTDDTAIHAWPVLARHRIPAAVFMITTNIGRPGFMTWDHLRQLHRGGITIGSHTTTHAYLPSVSLDQARQELVVSKQTLEDGLGAPVEFVSYPGGGFTPKICVLVQETGYRAACTTNRGIRRFPIDCLALRRITMHSKATSPFDLWIRCNGYSHWTRRLRAPA